MIINIFKESLYLKLKCKKESPKNIFLSIFPQKLLFLLKNIQFCNIEQNFWNNKTTWGKFDILN